MPATEKRIRVRERRQEGGGGCPPGVIHVNDIDGGCDWEWGGGSELRVLEEVASALTKYRIGVRRG